ncbi:CBS domain-containing protein [Zooshikella ganghwensis]|uniref:CBS domain-containing protein n=1 Tax=Zooshikella ganghwensis TaxID=202772 RepID=A0A4P9VNK4_9GAMM|nr:CBS domain-containing protein [Zooshikella ganghwensis]RDH45035.1 CBS domain-containing protein [Zooshikella ganghwensis]
MLEQSTIENNARDVFQGQKASDLMTTQVFTAHYDWSVNQLADFLVDHQISGAPVIDESGKLLGVVTLTDLVRYASLQSDEPPVRDSSFYQALDNYRLSSEERNAFRVTVDNSTLVADIMTPLVYEVEPVTPLVQVAEAMVRGKIHRVLVTQNKEVVGIISVLDLLKAAISL